MQAPSGAAPAMAQPMQPGGWRQLDNDVDMWSGDTVPASHPGSNNQVLPSTVALQDPGANGQSMSSFGGGSRPAGAPAALPTSAAAGNKEARSKASRLTSCKPWEPPPAHVMPCCRGCMLGRAPD